MPTNTQTVKDVFDSMNDEQQEAVHFLLGEALAHAEGDDDMEDVKPAAKAADSGDKTIKEIFDGMSEDEKNVVYFMIGQAIEDAEKEADSKATTLKQSSFSSEGTSMAHNVFERDSLNGTDNSPALSHADSTSIFEGAKRFGSIKEAVEDFALQHGIEDIVTNAAILRVGAQALLQRGLDLHLREIR